MLKKNTNFLVDKDTGRVNERYIYVSVSVTYKDKGDVRMDTGIIR